MDYLISVRRLDLVITKNKKNNTLLGRFCCFSVIHSENKRTPHQKKWTDTWTLPEKEKKTWNIRGTVIPI